MAVICDQICQLQCFDSDTNICIGYKLAEVGLTNANEHTTMANFAVTDFSYSVCIHYR